MDFKTKENIQSEIHTASNEVIKWLSNQDAEDFNKVFIKDKWTTAQHIYHLIKTTKAVANGMKIPKLVLKLKFGKINRPERSYDEMLTKYHTALATGIKAPVNFAAEDGRILDKDQMMSRFSSEMSVLAVQMGKWREKDLATYVLPHPAIGKCSIQEMGLFSILHTYHHLKILKRDYKI